MANIILPNATEVNFPVTANTWYKVTLDCPRTVDSFKLGTATGLATELLVDGAVVNTPFLVQVPTGKTTLYAKASGVESQYTTVTLEYASASAPSTAWTFPTVAGKAYVVVAPTACKIKDVASQVQLLDYTTTGVQVAFVATGSAVTTVAGTFDGQVVPCDQSTVSI